jgi:hypothetical protein
MIIWNTNRLAVAIAEKRIPSEEKFRYLLSSYCLFAVTGYVGSIFISPPGGWIFWYEALLVLVVTYFGLLRCRESYKGATDDRLLEICVILGFPLGIKLIAFTWIAHVSVGLGFRWLLSHITLTSESPFFPFVEFFLKAISQFYSFLIAAIGAALYYWRLSIHIKTAVNGGVQVSTAPNHGI